MNIELLDMMMTTSFSLRRLKKINVHQEHKIWNPRSNMHCLIVMPFGHQKSTIAKTIEDKKATYRCDTFTEASFKGTISKDGEIVPPIMKDFGGKIVFIDEWNSISTHAQESLLSAMENQDFKRSLGYTARRPVEWKDEFIHIKIEDNVIQSDYCFFSLVAFAMNFPSNNGNQSTMALLSRFVPIFVESDEDMIKAMMKGEWKINIKDYSNKIDEIDIKGDLFKKIFDAIWQFIQKDGLMPDDPDHNGFIIRCQADIIRIGIMYFYKDNWEKLRSLKKSGKKKLIVEIEDMKYFQQALEWFPAIMNQYLNPKTKGKIELYYKLVQEFPNETSEFYAKKMGCSVRQIYRYSEQCQKNGMI